MMFIEEEYNDNKVHFTVACTTEGTLTAVFTGSGSDTGTRTFIAIVEKALVNFPGTLCVLMDLRNQTSVPFTTQLRMGKWLLKIKDKVQKIAILGGGKTAQIVSRGANLQQIRFFSNTEENLIETWFQKID